MDSDVNAVSAAFAGIAETGTLALVSGPDNPTTLNFLPDNHIVVLPREAIEADYESVFAKLRGVYGKGGAPRTLNFITGPSRSADIEQTLLLGAHGPRRLHIVDRRLSSRPPKDATTASASVADVHAAYSRLGRVIPQREEFYSQSQQSP